MVAVGFIVKEIVNEKKSPAVTQTSDQHDSWPPNISSGELASHSNNNVLPFQSPQEWGGILSVKPFRSELNNEIPRISVIQFQNDIYALYQEGVKKLYWKKKIRTDSCLALDKVYEAGLLEYGNEGSCNVFTEGFYDPKALQMVVIENDLPYEPVGSEADFTTVTTFSIKDQGGQERSVVFSPQGNFFAKDGRAYEGCAIDIIFTETGKSISEEGSSCFPFLIFSPTERSIAVQAISSGMNSPLTEFTVYRDQEQFDLLSLLAGKRKEEMTGEDADPVQDIVVTSLSDDYIQFKVSKTNQWHQRGDYEFIFSSQTLKRK